MSFFISKDLEGKVDENCLIKNNDPENEKLKFVFLFNNTTCNLTEVGFGSIDSLIKTVSFKFECNIHILDKLFNDYHDVGKIVFKDSRLSLSNITIEKIFKKQNDIYTLEASATYYIETKEEIKDV